MDWLGDVLSSRGTVDGFVVAVFALLILAFIRGWLLTPFQIRNTLDAMRDRIADANKRGDDWKDAYDKQGESLKIALDQVDRLKSVGDTANRVLSSLPIPPNRGTQDGDS